MDSNRSHSVVWRSYQTEFTSGFHSLFKDETMVDVSLAVEGEILQAHKTVLSVCSPYFRNIFQVNPCQHPVVFLKDVSRSAVSLLLEFMYKGEVDVRDDDLTSFLQLADNLKIKGLSGQLITSSPSTRKRHRFKDSDNEDSESLKKQPRRRARCKRKNQEVTVEVINVVNDDTSNPDGADTDDTESDMGPLSRLLPGKAHSQDTEHDSDNDNIDFSGEINAEDCTPDQRQQGGVNYQMLQTKRGRDMLLYEGYTYNQNRVCKDGVRWACSYPRCRAFCRMSSAGWLTPHNTKHEHERPPEEKIRHLIMAMELKARAESSCATPGEIIRSLPPEEFQAPEKRACFTRCIQRYRKSLSKKSGKPDAEFEIANLAEAECKINIGPEQWMGPTGKIDMKVAEKDPLDGIWTENPQQHIDEGENSKEEIIK